MKSKNIKIIGGVLATAAIACFAFGFSAQSREVHGAAASAMSVNTLGYLQWDKHTDAASYEIGTPYGTLTSETATINVGGVLTQAANAASGDTASVTFRVTPVMSDGSKGSATEYTYTFSQLIDMDYTTHDITDYYAPAANGLNTALAKNSRNTFMNASYKNDLLTLGLQSEKDKNGNVLGWGGQLQLFCNTVVSNTNNTCLYTIYINNNFVRLYYGDGSLQTQTNLGNIQNTTIDGYGFEASGYAIQENVPYYISVGVFDTYALDGTKVGETVYYTCSYLSEGELITNQSLSKFLTVEELSNAGITDASYQMAGGGKLAGATLDRANFGYWPYSDTAFNSWLFSGELPETEKVTGLYYDNADGTFNWNALDNATAYEWTDGNNAWKTVEKTSVSVAELIAQYQRSYDTTGVGDLRLRVRAIVDGAATKETQLTMDITNFQKVRSTEVDVADAFSNHFADVVLPSDMTYNVKNQYTDRGWAYSYSDLIKPNTYLTLAFQTDILPTSTTGKILNVNLFGDLWDRGVWLSVVNNGRVAFSNHCETPTAENKNYWLSRNILPAFEAGKKYYVTFGVDEIYDLSGVQTAQRYTARFEVETDEFTRRTLGVLTYDNFEYAKEGLATSLTKQPYSAQLWLGGTDNGAPRVTYGSYGGSQYYADDVYNAVITINDDVFVENVSFGQEFDFSQYFADNYDDFSIIGWEYTTDQVNYKPFTATAGTWNLPSSAVLRAKIEYNRYTVTYVLPQSGDLSGVTNAAENPSQYTTQESVLLQAPENIPVGYLFDGWYAESDTQKQNKITDLKACKGDLRLVAAFVKGYMLTVETTETLVTAWKEGDAPFALVAPQIEGKTFVKWQALVGGEFVDYTGETTFTPASNMHLKAVYVETTYSITYKADGATHTNAQTYSAQSPLTFAKAEKAGSVFCGWYTDEALTNRIESTQGLTENLTVYAGFIDGGEVAGKATVGSKAQALPMLVLPSGCSYAVQLFEKGSETPLTLAENGTYAFSEAGKEYVVSYTVTSPYGQSVVKKIALTVENEQTITDVTPEPPASNDNGNGKLVWIIVGVVAGVLVVGGGVLLVCKKRDDDEE